MSEVSERIAARRAERSGGAPATAPDLTLSTGGASIASTPTKSKGDRTRIPMFSPEQKLAVPKIPGMVTYWFRGEPGRINNALRMGFNFVLDDEIDLNQFGLADDLAFGGPADLSHRVSRPAQDGANESGQFLRLYLMKISEEFYKEDLVKYVETKLDPGMRAINRGMVGAGRAPGEAPDDQAHRYQRPTAVPDMFKRKPVQFTS